MKIEFKEKEVIAKLRTLSIGSFFQCEGKLYIKLEDSFTNSNSKIILCRCLNDFDLELLEPEMYVIPIDHNNITLKYSR